jgi:16S rRNA (guanine966-N2)-methyltransferase
MTRIIAGSARGRRLAVPARGTRPTSDRVRESLFAILDSRLAADGARWADQSVLDLFAGSGAMGLEALSRGAARAVLVESDRAAARVARDNAASIGLPALVVARSVRSPGPCPQGPAGLVLADPPYDWAAEEVAGVLAGLVTSGWIDPAALVAVERPARDDASPLPAPASPTRRRFGDTALWYGRLTGERAEGDPPAREGDA